MKVRIVIILSLLAVTLTSCDVSGLRIYQIILIPVYAVLIAFKANFLGTFFFSKYQFPFLYHTYKKYTSPDHKYLSNLFKLYSGDEKYTEREKVILLDLIKLDIQLLEKKYLLESSSTLTEEYEINREIKDIDIKIRDTNLKYGEALKKQYRNSNEKNDGSNLVFYLYDDDDLEFCLLLEKHLVVLKRLNRISTWHKNAIKPGSNVIEEAAKKYKESNIVLLLVTVNLLNHEDFFPTLDSLKELSSEKLPIPLLMDYCHWETTELINYNFLPKDKEPVTSNKWVNRNQAITMIVKDILELIKV